MQRSEPTISWSRPEDPLSAFKDEFKAEVEGSGSSSPLEPKDLAQVSAESDNPLMSQVEGAVQDLLKRKVLKLPAVQGAREALLEFGTEDPDSCRARTEANCGDNCIWTDPLGEGPTCLPRLKSAKAERFALRQLGEIVQNDSPENGPAKGMEDFENAPN